MCLLDTQQPGLEKGFRGSGEMAQSVKCLSGKHDYPHKKSIMGVEDLAQW